jgi:hypothetical protein
MAGKDPPALFETHPACHQMMCAKPQNNWFGMSRARLPLESCRVFQDAMPSASLAEKLIYVRPIDRKLFGSERSLGSSSRTIPASIRRL